MADEPTDEQTPLRSIPIFNAKGEEKWINVPADMPAAQVKANMRALNVTHRPDATATTTTSTSQAPEKQPGLAGSLWEGVQDEALDPFAHSALGVSKLLTPQGVSESLERAKTHPFREALTQGGNVAGVVAPVLAPEATAASVLAHTVARGAGSSRGTAQGVGTAAGLVAPGARVLYEGTNVPRQLRQLGHAATAEEQAARAATSQRLENVINEADNRGITLNPTQRYALAQEIGDLNPSRGQNPILDRMENHLLDQNRDVTFSDLDRYHTDIRKRLPMSPTYTQAQDEALHATIRRAQEDTLQPHADLHGAWTDALDQWGQEIAPSQRLMAKVGRNRTTIESPAMSREFEAQQRAPGGPLGVPAVNERLRQARDIVRAQQSSGGAGYTVAAPLIGAALGGGAAGGSALSSGEKDPSTLAAAIVPAAIASAIASQGLRTGRVGLATPAGRAAAAHYLAVAPATAERSMTRVEPGMLDQLRALFR